MKFVTRADGECYKHVLWNRRYSLVANDTSNHKGEKHEFFLSKGGKVCFSSLRCEKDFCSYGKTLCTQGPLFCDLWPLFFALVRKEAAFTACKWCANKVFFYTHSWNSGRIFLPYDVCIRCKGFKRGNIFFNEFLNTLSSW